MRKLLLNTTPLFRKLRQLSLLLSLLLALPQTAWGQTTYNIGAYDSSNNTWGDWQVTASNTTLSSPSDNFLSFTVDGNTIATITLTLTHPGNTSEKICYAYFSYNQDSSIPDENKVKLLSAKIVHTNSSETDLTNDFKKYTKSCSFNAKTPVEWSSGDNFVVTLQVNNTTGAPTSHTIQAAQLKTGTPYGLIVNGITVTNVNQNSVNNTTTDFNGQSGVDEVVFTPEGSNSATLTLTKADFDVSSASIAAIESSLGSLKVILAGENEIKCGNNKAFNLADNSSLTITTNGTNTGQLTITSTSAITTESFYSPSSATVTYLNGLAASNPTSTSVLISPPTSYDITIAGVAVTNANASAITGTGITGTVSYDATTNTLTLNGAAVTGAIEYSGTTTLNFALDGTNSIINTGGTYAIGTSNYTNGLLNFAKATGASRAELTLTEGSSGIPISAGTPTLGSDLYWKPTSANTMVITSDPEFIIIDNLIMTDNRTVSGDNSVGTITYSSSNKTLTIDGFQKNFGTNHAIKTGVSGLKVKLIGASTINCSADSAVFHAFSSSASIQFIRNDATSKLTMTGTAFNNFAADKKTYDGHLFYYEYSGNKYIAQPDALSLGSSVLDDGNYNYFTHAKIYYSTNDRSDSYGYTAKYSAANPVIKYSIDYVDTNVSDVTNATYDTSGNGIKMNSPAIMTAWVEVGGAKSEVSTGVRFGVVANCVEMEFNGEEKEIDFSLQPASKAEGFSINFPNVSFAAFNSSTQKLTVKGCAKEDVYIGPTQPNTPPTDFSLLADSIKVVFNVTPPKPTLSLESGAYYPNQELTVTPMITGTEYSTTLKINNLDQTSPYTFNTVGRYDVRAVTSYSPSGSNVSYDGTPAEATYIINNQPVISAVYNDQTAYDGTKNGNVTYSIGIALLQANCTLMYYYGTDKSKAAAYTNTVDTVLVESKTVNAFIRYTDGTTTYDTAPVTVSYTVKQDLGINFAADQSYRTYYLSDYSLNKPQGVKAYIITGISENSVKTTAIDYIPQGVAVLLEKDGAAPAGGYVAETYTGTQGSFASNKLKYANTDVAATDDTYILYKNEFLKATGTIPNQHCYLDLSGVAPARGMYGIGNDGSTAIEGIDVEATEDETWYDLQGRRIQKPTKAGIYIVNGKKMIINNK